MKTKFAGQQLGAVAQNLVEEFVRSLEGATSLTVAPERRFEVEFPALDGPQRLDVLLRVEGKPGQAWHVDRDRDKA